MYIYIYIEREREIPWSWVEGGKFGGLPSFRATCSWRLRSDGVTAHVLGDPYICVYIYIYIYIHIYIYIYILYTYRMYREREIDR